MGNVRARGALRRAINRKRSSFGRWVIETGLCAVGLPAYIIKVTTTNSSSPHSKQPTNDLLLLKPRTQLRVQFASIAIYPIYTLLSINNFSFFCV